MADYPGGTRHTAPEVRIRENRIRSSFQVSVDASGKRRRTSRHHLGGAGIRREHPNHAVQFGVAYFADRFCKSFFIAPWRVGWAYLTGFGQIASLMPRFSGSQTVLVPDLRYLTDSITCLRDSSREPTQWTGNPQQGLELRTDSSDRPASPDETWPACGLAGKSLLDALPQEFIRRILSVNHSPFPSSRGIRRRRSLP
jgi:hypothetical protein